MALAALAVATIMLTTVPVTTSTDTGSMNYITPGVVRVNHGLPCVGGIVPGVNCLTRGTGVTICSASLEATLGGCIGGGIIPSDEARAIRAAGGDLSTAIKYLKMTAIATDTLNGPNIHVLLCNYNPAGGSTCETDGSGNVDGFRDAAAEGCGVGLTADSTDVHPGNFQATVWIGILWIDVGTTEVCFGTQGTMSILFW